MRRSTRHTGPVEGYDAGTYGDRFADVYDDWYGDVTDVGACTHAPRRAGRRSWVGAQCSSWGSARVGWRCRWPNAGVEVHGIDASPRDARAAAGQAGRRRDPGDARRHGRPRPRRPAPVHGRVRRLQHVLQPGDRRRAAALPRSGRRAPRAHRPVRAGGVRAQRGRRPPRTAPSRRGTSPPTRWCSRSASTIGRTQTITGQHIHVTDAGIRLRPWHLRYATTGAARRDGRGGRAGARVAARRLGWRPRSGPTRASTSLPTVAVTSETCDPPALLLREPAPPQPADGPLGHRGRRAGCPARAS